MHAYVYLPIGARAWVPIGAGVAAWAQAAVPVPALTPRAQGEDGKYSPDLEWGEGSACPPQPPLQRAHSWKAEAAPTPPGPAPKPLPG